MSLHTTAFDTSLDTIQRLTWLPWIGCHYAQRSPANRIMIVGESHYANEEDETEAREVIAQRTADRQYTREIVQELGPDRDWENKTYNALHKALFLTDAPNREAFWSDVCCYNFVQRMMWYDPDDPERPTWEDFVEGWLVCLEIVALIKPAHCLFVGGSAANHFDGFMAGQSLPYTPVEHVEKVGRTWGRRASVEVEGHTTSIHFIQHSGKYFSWEAWHEYLLRQASEMMNIVTNHIYRSPAPTII